MYARDAATPCTCTNQYAQILLPWHLRILFITLLICIATIFCAGSGAVVTGYSVFSPQSITELKSAVAACLELSPEGDYSEGPHGPIGEWDVSSVTDMSLMFAEARSFKADISKWDVSSVVNMNSMFHSAASFNGDISKWDVSSVTDMRSMFGEAKSFNVDLSKWDVSSVTDMSMMFKGASSFAQTLCGAWSNSTANKEGMFEGSSGRICRKSTSIETPTLT